MYAVEFSINAEKQLYALEELIQGRILNVLERIKVRPLHFIRKLAGNEDYYRLRAGDYRIILSISEKDAKIFVVKLGHRKNIYE